MMKSQNKGGGEKCTYLKEIKFVPCESAAFFYNNNLILCCKFLKVNTGWKDQICRILKIKKMHEIML